MAIEDAAVLSPVASKGLTLRCRGRVPPLRGNAEGADGADPADVARQYMAPVGKPMPTGFGYDAWTVPLAA